MKADFTRGHNPDTKRGQNYRRVLLQQKRLILDSDIAALVDSNEQQHRDLSADLGCRSGSPDLGFLVTPGRLQAVFEDIQGITGGTTEQVHRDYSIKYKDRFPSLHLNATSGNLNVTIPLRNPIEGPGLKRFALWALVKTPTWISVDVEDKAPLAVHIPETDTFIRKEVTFSLSASQSFQEIVVNLNSNEEVWLGLIEDDEASNSAPHFWVAGGHYHLNGLIFDNPSDQGYPDITYPQESGFDDDDFSSSPAGKRIVAFLEGWERLVTEIEDPGIRENALGDGPDTTVRTRALGQVKWLNAGSSTKEEILEAFANPARPDGTLDFETISVDADLNPCALNLSGGYTGGDNRLYRFEVHQGGDLGTAKIKWSRDNGSEQFPIEEVSGSTIILAAHSGLEDGDIIEILSDVIDLGDETLASINSGGAFVRPERMVGQLVRLKALPSDEQGRDQFQLLDLNNADVTITPSDDVKYEVDGSGINKVRRWNGLIVTNPPSTGPDPRNEIELERGVKITLRGEFSVGDYWQYEARKGRDNVNGIWQAEPHGPERFFAPLAILAPGGPIKPFILEAWLDTRFSRLCQLNADDIAFDGNRLGEESDTVQEIIETILERDRGGCCEITIAPQDIGDDSQRIQDAIAELPNGGVLCLKPGVYRLESKISLDGREITIRGCPDATIVGDNVSDTLFSVKGGSMLGLETLTLFSGPEPNSYSLVALEGNNDSIKAREVGFIGALRNETASLINQGGAAITVSGLDVGEYDPDSSIDIFDLDALPSPPNDVARIDLSECVILAGWGIAGGEIDEVFLSQTACYTIYAGIYAQKIGNLQLSKCALKSCLDNGFLSAINASDIRETEGQLLLEASQKTASEDVCVYCEQLLSGDIERNYFGGLHGIAAQFAQDTFFEGNEYHTDRIGIRIAQSLRIMIKSEWVFSVQIGIHLPLVSNSVSIEGNYLQSEYGIVIGQDTKFTSVDKDTRFIENVSIFGNELDDVRFGIYVGRNSDDLFDIIANNVNISQNILSGSDDDEVLEKGIQVWTGGEDLLDTSFHITIDGNHLSGYQNSIWISSPNCVIRSNSINVKQTKDYGPSGISVSKTKEAEISDNHILCQEDLDKAMKGVHISDVTTYRIVGNVVQSAQECLPLFAQSSENSIHVIVADNNLSKGESSITGANYVQITCNTFDHSLVLVKTIDGDIRNNTFINGTENSLDIQSAAGSWQVENNRASGTINILPKKNHDKLPFKEYNVREVNKQGDSRFLLGQGAESLALISMLAGQKEILYRYRNSGEGGPPIVTRSRSSVTDTTRPGWTHPDVDSVLAQAEEGQEEQTAALLAATYPTMNTLWSIASINYVFGKFEEELTEVVDAKDTEEAEYHVQVNGNWSKNLQVGHVFEITTYKPFKSMKSTRIDTHEDSIVQVVGNRADLEISVNLYKHRVVAHNIAGNFVAVTANGSVQEPNLEV